MYGAEAVLSADLEFDSPRAQMYTDEGNPEAREDSVDLLEEARLQSLSRSASYQQALCWYHTSRIRPLAFREGDPILRLVQTTVGRHKVSPPWEGPFIISKALHNNSYYLIDAQQPRKNKMDKSDEETERLWNPALLRPFYT